MDYSKMNKKQLIELLKQLEEKRAFTYEDQMKLQIIDKAPFTLWACDKNFNIRLWTCQCESMYGYSKEEILGKNYLPLFIAPDERYASQKDCDLIINEGMPFFNCVAQDEGRKGKRTIITNCFRIIDVETNEFLQAEIGLDISNLDSEKEKYDKVIQESKLVSLKKAQLHDSIKNLAIYFRDDIAEIETHIFENERKVIEMSYGKRKIYKEKVNPISSRITEEKKKYDLKFHKIEDMIKEAMSIEECENAEREIEKVNREIDLLCKELSLDLDEIYFVISNNDLNSSVKEEKLHMKNKEKRFRIALSFPGEYRENIIDKIALKLAKTYSRDEILYDKFHSAEFARINLDTYLQTLYHDDSELIVVFLCEDYSSKPWCGIEWRSIRDLLNDKNESNRIMPIKLGDGKVDGIFNTIDGYITATEKNTDEIVKQIIIRYKMT